MVIADIDIWRSANLLRRRHGKMPPLLLLNEPTNAWPLAIATATKKFPPGDFVIASRAKMERLGHTNHEM
ncbi:MAG TPA: hypothetical protein VGU20_27050 [Stellaceae bacterium]|nr:hypothetical protein [Stellaceae bacterium]